MPNKIAGELLEARVIKELAGWNLIGREVKYENSRIDFLLNKIDALDQKKYLEVKSVSLVEEGIAKFPDAPTIRGTRHLKHLQEIVKKGHKAAVLFVLQRKDANIIRPHWKRDPTFAKTLVEAKENGVEIYGIKTEMTPIEVRFIGSIDVDLTQPDDIPSEQTSIKKPRKRQNEKANFNIAKKPKKQ